MAYFSRKPCFSSASSATSSAMITHEIKQLFRFSGRTEERIEKQKQIINHPPLSYKKKNMLSRLNESWRNLLTLVL